ncbi:hypothetical protein FX016_18330 [Cupriavidus gilardii]|nr:hypothetical protein FX016_18330 [Cupriavidus gilardii]
MAAVNFFDNFETLWAQAGALEVIDDNQYKQGWAYIGATPPSVEQFNKVQQLSDQKAAWLFRQVMALAAEAGVSVTEDSVNALSGSVSALIEMAKGRLIGVKVFSTPGTTTYTPTEGTKSVVVEVQGGGGAGGGSQATTASTVSVCPGGNAGAYGKSRINSGFSGVPVVVGAGGAGALGANGGNGGSSSFGAFVSAPGGQGAPSYVAASAPVLNINSSAQSLASGGNVINASGGRGQPAVASGVTFGGSGDGGASFFGSGGRAAGAVSTPTNGAAGVAPGSGGSGGAGGGGAGASTGGAGAPGIVIVWEYA